MDSLRLLCCLQVIALGQAHIQNYTTITLFTNPITWNEAYEFCRSTNGHLLDITYYSVFSTILDRSQQSPWKDVPLGNGPPVWIGLHQRENLLGEEYYSTQCEPLSDFRVVYWNTEQPYTLADGPISGYCVYDEIIQNRVENTLTAMHDYTRANCTEKHTFFCQYESNDPCYFELIPNSYGKTNNDFSPDNDVSIPYTTNEACAERCLSESAIYPYPSLNVLEECWGYSIRRGECIMHIVVKPSFFATDTNRAFSGSSELYVKKCFEASVNTDIQAVVTNDNQAPNTTCGHLDLGESQLAFLNVTVLEGTYTWNEGLSLCENRSMEMLHIRSDTDNIALSQVLEKYQISLPQGTFWLGLHEPEPTSKPNIRVWSNCEAESMTNWGQLPTGDVLDTNFCVTLDVASSYTWRQASCSDLHHVICMGMTDDKPSYSTGQTGVTGVGVSLGHIHMNMSACEDTCSTITYDGLDCWAYSHMTTTDGFCYLYFAQNSTFYMEHVAEANNSFLFRRKMIWSDELEQENSFVSDSSLFPYSCCDVSGITSGCPANNVPSYEVDVVTTDRTEFVLFSGDLTWNDAVTECTTSGGHLLHVDTVSKYHVIMHYISDWIQGELMSSEVWIGLSQEHLMDPCSLRWDQGCSAPQWVPFGNQPFTEIDGRYCVAIGKDGLVKAACNETRGFVCEFNAGSCTIEAAAVTGCPLTPSDDRINQLGIDTCISDCLTTVHNGRECWATVQHDENSSCTLLFYSDPLYCKYTTGSDITGFVSHKECFSSSSKNAVSLFFADSRPEPHNGCYVPFILPVTRDEEICSPMSSTISNLITSTQSMISSITPLSSASTSVFSSVTLSESTISPTPASSFLLNMESSTVSSSSSWTNIFTSFQPLVTISSSELGMLSTDTIETISSILGTVTLATSTMMYSSTPTLDISSPLSFVSTSATTVETTIRSNVKLPTYVKPIYLSPCFCRPSNYSALDLEQWEIWLTTEHHVLAKNTSRYRRGVTSAWDSRTSSMSIGATAISVLICLAVFLIVMDISNVVRDVRFFHGDRTVSNNVTTVAHNT